MIRRLLPILLLAGLPIGFLPACSAKPVEYSTEGEAHCPTCQSQLQGRPLRCTRCDTKLRWAGGEQTCWHCDGVKTCKVCAGSGEEGGEDRPRPCYACQGEGECQHCNDFGLIEHGGS